MRNPLPIFAPYVEAPSLTDLDDQMTFDREVFERHPTWQWFVRSLIPADHSSKGRLAGSHVVVIAVLPGFRTRLAVELKSGTDASQLPYEDMQALVDQSYVAGAVAAYKTAFAPVLQQHASATSRYAEKRMKHHGV